MAFTKGRTPWNKRPAAESSAATPASAESAPSPEEHVAAAQAAWHALTAEQDAIEAELAEHRAQRQQWLQEGGKLDAIAALAQGDERLRLRLEEISARLPAVQGSWNRAAAILREARWERLRPSLAVAEAELHVAIAGFEAALNACHAAQAAAAAQGFATELRNEFVAPPPLGLFNLFSLRQFVATVEQRRHPVPAAPEIVVEVPADVSLEDAMPAAERFRPRKVPYGDVEAISPLAPTRRVRIVHGPVKTVNLGIGEARLRVDEVRHVSARAAHALVQSGVAEYLDNEPATTA